MIEHFLLCKFCTLQLWLNKKLWVTEWGHNLSHFKIAKSSVCLFHVSLCIFSLNPDTHSKTKKKEKTKVAVCSCCNKFNLFWLIFFGGEKWNAESLSRFKGRGKPRRLSTSKWKSNGKTQSKTNPNMSAALNQKNKSISCFGSKLFRPQLEYYSVWLQCKVPVYQTLSTSLNARRTMTCYQRFLWDLDVTHHYISLWKKKKKRKKERKLKESKPLCGMGRPLLMCTD